MLKHPRYTIAKDEWYEKYAAKQGLLLCFMMFYDALFNHLMFFSCSAFAGLVLGSSAVVALSGAVFILAAKPGPGVVLLMTLLGLSVLFIDQAGSTASPEFPSATFELVAAGSFEYLSFLGFSSMSKSWIGLHTKQNRSLHFASRYHFVSSSTFLSHFFMQHEMCRSSIEDLVISSEAQIWFSEGVRLQPDHPKSL